MGQADSRPTSELLGRPDVRPNPDLADATGEWKRTKWKDATERRHVWVSEQDERLLRGRGDWREGDTRRHWRRKVTRDQYERLLAAKLCAYVVGPGEGTPVCTMTNLVAGMAEGAHFVMQWELSEMKPLADLSIMVLRNFFPDDIAYALQSDTVQAVAQAMREHSTLAQHVNESIKRDYKDLVAFTRKQNNVIKFAAMLQPMIPGSSSSLVNVQASLHVRAWMQGEGLWDQDKRALTGLGCVVGMAPFAVVQVRRKLDNKPLLLLSTETRNAVKKLADEHDAAAVNWFTQNAGTTAYTGLLVCFVVFVGLLTKNGKDLPKLLNNAPSHSSSTSSTSASLPTAPPAELLALVDNTRDGTPLDSAQVRMANATPAHEASSAQGQKAVPVTSKINTNKLVIQAKRDEDVYNMCKGEKEPVECANKRCAQKYTKDTVARLDCVVNASILKQYETRGPLPRTQKDVDQGYKFLQQSDPGRKSKTDNFVSLTKDVFKNMKANSILDGSAPSLDNQLAALEAREEAEFAEKNALKIQASRRGQLARQVAAARQAAATRLQASGRRHQARSMFAKLRQQQAARQAAEEAEKRRAHEAREEAEKRRAHEAREEAEKRRAHEAREEAEKRAREEAEKRAREEAEAREEAKAREAMVREAAAVRATEEVGAERAREETTATNHLRHRRHQHYQQRPPHSQPPSSPDLQQGRLPRPPPTPPAVHLSGADKKISEQMKTHSMGIFDLFKSKASPPSSPSRIANYTTRAATKASNAFATTQRTIAANTADNVARSYKYGILGNPLAGARTRLVDAALRDAGQDPMNLNEAYNRKKGIEFAGHAKRKATVDLNRVKQENTKYMKTRFQDVEIAKQKAIDSIKKRRGNFDCPSDKKLEQLCVDLMQYASMGSKYA